MQLGKYINKEGNLRAVIYKNLAFEVEGDVIYIDNYVKAIVIIFQPEDVNLQSYFKFYRLGQSTHQATSSF